MDMVIAMVKNSNEFARESRCSQHLPDIIATFQHRDSIENMPISQLCSFCYRERRAMMQRTPYSVYNEHYQRQLEYIYSRCESSGPTEAPPSPFRPRKPQEAPFCTSGKVVWTEKTETCDSIALRYSLSSASLFMANQPAIRDCNSISGNTSLCLPLPCKDTYVLQPGDSCWSVDEEFYDDSRGITFGDLLPAYNPWISHKCRNLHEASKVYGRTLCLSPQNGFHDKQGPGSIADKTVPRRRNGYTWEIEEPPEACKVAENATRTCGSWHQARKGDTCASISISQEITGKLLLAANPSLGKFANECDENLTIGKTYCVRIRYG